MRTSFALTTLLFAIAAIAAPVADAEAGLEKRQYPYYQTTDTATAPTSTYSPGSSGPADSGLDSDEQSVLDAHNKYRSQHSADPLTWSSDLASYAASYASSCVFEHTGGNPIIFDFD